MACGNAETFSTEDDFNKWKEDLWSSVFSHFASSETAADKKKGLQRRSSVLIADPNVLPFVVDTSGIQLQENDDVAPEYDMNMRNYLSAKPLPIKSVRELRQRCIGGGSTIEVIFDLRGSGMTYKTGANSAIYALNKDEDVQKFAEMFALDLDQRFCFVKNPAYKGRAAKNPFPTSDAAGMTVREALTKHLNLTNPIQKKVLTLMINHCEAQEDKTL